MKRCANCSPMPAKAAAGCAGCPRWWCWLPRPTMVPGHPPHRRHALVLAWDGGLVEEGIDRASRRRSPKRPDGVIAYQVRRLLLDASRRPGLSLTALGTVVLLDADHKEIR